MTDSLRARIAFILGCTVRSKDNNRPIRLYDEERKLYIPMNIIYSGDNYNLYDYNTQTHLNGNSSYMFDYETNKYINFKLINNTFTGIILDKQSHINFNGRINDYIVSIYDYDFNKYYNYIIQ